jgi:hypothetical protein
VIIRRIHWCVLASVLACACRANGNTGASGANGLGTNAKQETSDVSEELRQLSAHPDLEVVIRTGTQHWKAGEITLTVRGDGAAAVLQRQASGETPFDATLTKDEVDRFGRELGEHHFTASRTSKLPRKPGDTPVRLALQHGGKPGFEVQIWEADRHADAELDAILVAGRRLLHRVTKGALGAP